MKKGKLVALTVAILCLLMVGSSGAEEKKKKKDSRTADRIQATATSTGTQTGQMISVTIIVYEYSPADDQKILLEAFESGGQEGLTNAVSKMSAKGRIAVTGTLGYDLNYIRQFPIKDSAGNVTGRKIRFVTDRPITVGEAWSQSRSMEYSLSGGEVDLSNEKKKSTGTLLPACKFKISKEKDLEIEALQNPWRLVNIYED